MTALERHLIEENKEMMRKLEETCRELGAVQGELMYIYQRYPRLCMGIVRGGKYKEGGCHESYKNQRLRLVK